MILIDLLVKTNKAFILDEKGGLHMNLILSVWKKIKIVLDEILKYRRG